MEMPKNCMKCNFRNEEEGKCTIDGHDLVFPDDTEHVNKDCTMSAKKEDGQI